MNTRKTADVPAKIEPTRRRFEQWRQRRKVSTPIPESLWAAAVKVAGRYGISRTAWALGVGYDALKDRVEKATFASTACSPPRNEARLVVL